MSTWQPETVVALLKRQMRAMVFGLSWSWVSSLPRCWEHRTGGRRWEHGSSEGAFQDDGQDLLLKVLILPAACQGAGQCFLQRPTCLLALSSGTSLAQGALFMWPSVYDGSLRLSFLGLSVWKRTLILAMAVPSCESNK